MATTDLLAQLDKAINDAVAKQKEYNSASERERNSAEALQTARNTVSDLRKRLDQELNQVVGSPDNRIRVSE